MTTVSQVAKPWTPGEVEVLKALFAEGHAHVYIAMQLRRSRGSVAAKLRTLGLKKPPNQRGREDFVKSGWRARRAQGRTPLPSRADALDEIERIRAQTASDMTIAIGDTRWEATVKRCKELRGIVRRAA